MNLPSVISRSAFKGDSAKIPPPPAPIKSWNLSFTSPPPPPPLKNFLNTALMRNMGVQTVDAQSCNTCCWLTPMDSVDLRDISTQCGAPGCGTLFELAFFSSETTDLSSGRAKLNYTQTDRQTFIQTDRQTDRQTDGAQR